eukprot:scaffold105818_cov28-Tisochrysis_lutea.AAC.1
MLRKISASPKVPPTPPFREVATRRERIRQCETHTASGAALAVLDERTDACICSKRTDRRADHVQRSRRGFVHG